VPQGRALGPRLRAVGEASQGSEEAELDCLAVVVPFLTHPGPSLKKLCVYSPGPDFGALRSAWLSLGEEYNPSRGEFSMFVRDLISSS